MALLAVTALTARAKEERRDDESRDDGVEDDAPEAEPHDDEGGAGRRPPRPPGSVSSQPTMMRPTVRQRTIDPRRPSPDPMTEPEATCVVDSAKPRALEERIVAAVEDSAANPCAGLTSVRPLPSVRMIRQPPM